MRKAITETAIALRLVWFRVACYFALPAWGAFELATGKMTGADWAALTSFEKNRIYGACAAAGLLNLVAFIDSAMAKARQQVQEHADQANEKIKLEG